MEHIGQQQVVNVSLRQLSFIPYLLQTVLLLVSQHIAEIQIVASRQHAVRQLLYPKDAIALGYFQHQIQGGHMQQHKKLVQFLQQPNKGFNHSYLSI